MAKPLNTTKTTEEIAKLMAVTVRLNADASKMQPRHNWYSLLIGAALAITIIAVSRLFT